VTLVDQTTHDVTAFDSIADYSVQFKFVETEYLQATSIFRPSRDQIGDADWLYRPAGVSVVHLIRSLIRRQCGSRGSKRPSCPTVGLERALTSRKTHRGNQDSLHWSS